MIVETQHGSFECLSITRKQRRELYRKVKEVYKNEENVTDLEQIHDLAEEFVMVAFGTEENAEKALGGLSALEEDEVLMEIINSYMGFKNPNGVGG